MDNFSYSSTRHFPHTPPEDQHKHEPVKSDELLSGLQNTKQDESDEMDFESDLPPDTNSQPADFKSDLLLTNTNSNTLSSEDTPGAYVRTRIYSLLMWENPIASGLALSSSLGLLILTSYVSLLRVFCGVATIFIGANWAYVNLMIQGQRLFAGTDGVNPHSSRLTDALPALSRERIDHAVDFAVELFNTLMHEAIKVALIDDNSRSLRYVIGLYAAWTLAAYVPANWLLGISIVAAFSGPRLYSSNKATIDENIAHWQSIAKVHLNNATATSKQQARILYDKARSYAANAQNKIQKAAAKTDVPYLKKEE
jgi:hypothetical protein